ncbi:hypothetical protein ABZY90_35675 [Streptomyces sp. NPDC006422]|uniref:hypothetical protein n=1 Tax=unclassified Streptomyces TaxID=2593676 RepID=UPI0033BB6043
MYDSDADDRLLMLAVTGERLPDDDPAAAGVAADVALLRDQVRGLGDALASRPEPEPEPRSVPVRRRRGPRLAFGALVAACAVSLFGGLVWLGVSAPGGDGDAASSADDKAVAEGGGKAAPSRAALHIACSKVLVEGRVTSITPDGDGRVRVVLDVKRYYRPERSVHDHPTLTVTLDAMAREDLAPGTYTLIRTPVRAGDREDWETGWGVADARRDIAPALPESHGLRCEAPASGAP